MYFAKKLNIEQRQWINQVARKLDEVLRRYVGPDGKIVDAIVDGVSVLSAPKPTRPATRRSPRMT